MIELKSAESAVPETAPRRRNKFLQWNIATLLLLMALVGVWSSYFRMKSETGRMDAELDSLLELARELVVHDPSQYAIVERHEQWYGDHVWDVHLPEGSRYLLKLATRGIDMQVWVRGTPRDDLPETGHVVVLAAGQHVISLEKTLRGEQVSARAIVDGKLAMNVSESSDDWYPDRGFSFGQSYVRSTQALCDEPLELIRVRFNKPRGRGVSSAPNEKYNGVFLWIERE